VVRAALDLLPDGAERVRIAVSPADVELVRRTLAEAADGPESIVTGSDDIQRGGCRISAPCGDIDATLDTRMQRILETLGLGQDSANEP
jgi:flagellar assembly protein FliH